MGSDLKVKFRGKAQREILQALSDRIGEFYNVVWVIAYRPNGLWARETKGLPLCFTFPWPLLYFGHYKISLKELQP
jgi:hypothetical protein